MSFVRLAGPEDEGALFDLLMAYKATDAFYGFSVDDARVGEHIQAGTRGRGGLHGVIDAPDKPGVMAGSIGMVWDRWWFSSEWGLAQLWLFIRPEYRAGTHYADELVTWAKERRAEMEAAAGQPIVMANVVISEERLDAKLRFWEKHSGKMIGAIFSIK
jgi:hypothetical protein